MSVPAAQIAEPVVVGGMARKSPVCIIVQNESFGGMEIHTLGLMQALIDRGYPIELIANRYDGYDPVIQAHGWQDRVRIIHTELDGIIYGTRGSERQWKRLFQQARGRVLIFPRGDCNYGQRGFLRACRRAFEKVFFVEHLEARPRPKNSRRWLGIIPGLHLWWHRRRVLSKLSSRYADRIIAVSESVRERLIRDFGYRPDKIVVVHNGVAWQKLPRDAAQGAAFRARHGIPTGAFVLGMLIRLQHQKGIDVALQALRLFVERNPSADPYLVIAGEGSELQQLTRLTHSLQLEDRVKFIGFVRDIAAALSGYDVILFSSRNEGLPLGLLEGMAAGCIPIVTRVSGMPEAVNCADLGCVVPPDDPAQLSVAMERIHMLDAQALARMRRNVTESVRRDFDIADCHRKILEVCGLQAV
jgi:glycosyltransferase involved in cell wall biosynthesis